MPQTPIIKVRLFPGANPADAGTWGNPVDVSAYVRYPGSDGGQAITYSGGRQNEAQRVDSSRMSLTLDNRDGRFSPTNPNGPYFGKLRRGTPIIMSTQVVADDFNRTAASLGSGYVGGTSFTANGSNATASITPNTLSSPVLADGGAYNVDGRMTVWVNQVATGANVVIGALARIDPTVSTRSLMVRTEFNTSGNVDIRIGYRNDSGIFTLAEAPNWFSYAANTKVRLRYQVDGAAFRAKIWKPANPATPDADEPSAWTVQVTSGVPFFGVRNGFFGWVISGNTNTGLTMNVDDLVIDAPEFTGYVASWPMDWDITGRNSWAAIQASGILRRLQQGSGTAMSPLRRQLAAYDYTAYWPLEDGPDAIVFGAVSSNTAGARYTAVQPAADSTLPGATVSPSFTDANSRIRGGVNRSQSKTTGFAAMFFVKMSSVNTNKTILNSWSGTGRISVWQIILEAGASGVTVLGYENDGTLTVNSTFGGLGVGVDVTQWVAWQLETTWDGTNINWTLINYQVGNATGAFNAFLGSPIPSTAPVRCRSFVLGGQDLNGASWGHVWIGEESLPFVDATFLLVSSGYAGEKAVDRLTRLCREQGVPLVIESTDDSERLGKQRNGVFLENLQAAEDADGGTLYEAGAGLGYRPLRKKYGVAVDRALSKAAGEVGEVPSPTIDDAFVRNQWTVSRDQGSSATVSDLGHIAAEGLYEDSTSINVADDNRVDSHASWRVFLGTRSDMRWPQLALDLVRNPQLVSFWRAANWGQRFTVAMDQVQTATADPDVILEGWTVSLWPHGWKINTNCSPARPYDIPKIVAAQNTVTEAIIDSVDTTLGTSISSTTTAITIQGTPWVNTGWFPFNIVINGEVMRVTASTVPSGGSQAFTVVRSVNGVVKAHASGSEVHAVDLNYNESRIGL